MMMEYSSILGGYWDHALWYKLQKTLC